MRVLYVLPSLCIGGMERFVQRLSHEMLQRGHDASVACTVERGILADDVAASGVPVQLCRLESKRELLFSPTLLAHMQEVRPDIVHSQSGVWLPAAIASWRAGVPLVHTEHGLPVGGEPWRAMVTKWAASRVTSSAVAVSAPLREHLSRLLTASRVQTILNGVSIEPVDASSRQRARAALGIDDSATVFVAVARLDYIKGLDVLLEAMAQLGDTAKTVDLVIIGDGPERSSLENLAASRNLSRVRFLGARGDVQFLLAAFDGLLLPSRSEGLPLAVLEAMANSVPVLATPVGEVPAVLAHGEAGMIASGNDPRAFSRALEEFIVRADLREQFRERGLHRVRAEYSFEAMSDRYDELYREVARPRRHTRPVY